MSAEAVAVVMLELGLPVVPPLEDTASRTEEVETPENEAAPSLMALVAPVTVTARVADPVLVGERYQSSADLVPVRVLVAFVKAAPFQVADEIDPVPPISWKISAMRTTRVEVVETVWLQEFVVGPAL